MVPVSIPAQAFEPTTKEIKEESFHEEVSQNQNKSHHEEDTVNVSISENVQVFIVRLDEVNILSAKSLRCENSCVGVHE